MIIDRTPLSGAAAYLTDANGSIDLTAAGSSTHSFVAGERSRIVDVEGIDLVLGAASFSPLLARGGSSLVRVEVRKELFPGLFRDPYESRVWSLVGSEDLRRGDAEHFRVLDVEGLPTLVSEAPVGRAATWTSRIHVLDRPTTFRDVAWTLAPDVGTPSDAFDYAVDLETWDLEPSDPLAVRTLSRLVRSANPGDPRFVTLAAGAPAAAFRVKFSASVRRAVPLDEWHETVPIGRTVGVPLLQAVHLVEERPSRLDFWSLAELSAGSRTVDWLSLAGMTPTSLLARIDLRALLTGSESIAIRVRPSTFSAAEARIVGSIVDRPPGVVPAS